MKKRQPEEGCLCTWPKTSTSASSPLLGFAMCRGSLLGRFRRWLVQEYTLFHVNHERIGFVRCRITLEVHRRSVFWNLAGWNRIRHRQLDISFIRLDIVVAAGDHQLGWRTRNQLPFD